MKNKNLSMLVAGVLGNHFSVGTQKARRRQYTSMFEPRNHNHKSAELQGYLMGRAEAKRVRRKAKRVSDSVIAFKNNPIQMRKFESYIFAGNPLSTWSNQFSAQIARATALRFPSIL